VGIDALLTGISAPVIYIYKGLATVHSPDSQKIDRERHLPDTNLLVLSYRFTEEQHTSILPAYFSFDYLRHHRRTGRSQVGEGIGESYE